MKLVTQTADEIVLKDSDWNKLIFGIVFVIVGVCILPIIIGEVAHGSFVILILLLFPIIGIWMAVSASWFTVDMNKTTGQIVVSRRQLIGGGAQTYAISDAARVELRKAYQQSGRSSTLVHQSVLVLRDGTEVALDHSSGGSTGVSINNMPVLLGMSGKELSIGEQVATFLGVPFQEIQPPGMQMNFGGPAAGIQL